MNRHPHAVFIVCMTAFATRAGTLETNQLATPSIEQRMIVERCLVARDSKQIQQLRRIIAALPNGAGTNWLSPSQRKTISSKATAPGNGALRSDWQQVVRAIQINLAPAPAPIRTALRAREESTPHRDAFELSGHRFEAMDGRVDEIAIAQATKGLPAGEASRIRSVAELYALQRHGQWQEAMESREAAIRQPGQTARDYAIVEEAIRRYRSRGGREPLLALGGTGPFALYSYMNGGKMQVPIIDGAIRDEDVDRAKRQAKQEMKIEQEMFGKRTYYAP